MSTERKQYPAVDIAKFCCALLILFYHYFSEHGPVAGFVEDFLSLYAVAVALFMTLSGYLTFYKVFRERDTVAAWPAVWKQVKRIMVIYLLWSVPYLFFSIIRWNWAEGTVTPLFVLLKVRGWIFQSTYYTIWFMPSLALGLLLAYGLYCKLPWGAACAVGFLLYLLGSLQSTYAFLLKGVPCWGVFATFSDTWLQGCRGGIFFGAPLILLGGCAAKIRWRKPVTLGVMSMITMALLLTEAILLRRYVGGCGLDLAMMMIPVCLMLTMFLTSISWKSGDFCRWLRAMSVLIFMSQRIFLTVIPQILPESLKNRISANSITGCLMVCGGTILFDVVLLRLSKKSEFLRKLY